jgi:hypothetical protein
MRAGSGLSGAGVPDRPCRSELLPPVQGGGPHGVLPLPPPLGVGIIVRYKGRGIWVLTAFWRTLFQQGVSPFNWIDTAMQDVGRKVGLMLENEASREPEAKEVDERNMEDLRRKYSWWLGGQGKGGLTAPARGFGAEAEDIVNLTQEESIKL